MEGGNDVIVSLSDVDENAYGHFFSLGSGFKKVPKNAGSVWTVGPNAQDFCVFTKKENSVWTGPECLFSHNAVLNL